MLDGAEDAKQIQTGRASVTRTGVLRHFLLVENVVFRSGTLVLHDGAVSRQQLRST